MNFEIITRAQWGAKYGRGNAMPAGAKSHVIVHHDGINRSKPGMSVAEESKILRIFEDFHAGKLTKANPRIAYSWVVMQTGRIYEGIGWGRVGAHTKGLNSNGYAWCFPIHGGETKPTEDAINAFRWHVSEGVRLGHLVAHPTVSGHQDHGKPSCPGAFLYEAAVTRFVPYVHHTVVADVPSTTPEPLPGPPRVVYSPSLGDYLIVTRYASDTDWSFIRAKSLAELGGVKAATPLSKMPANGPGW